MIVDLNCDMGELEDALHEAALMQYITSANIACGGHAGDEATMERTARLAIERGVHIGELRGDPAELDEVRMDAGIAERELEVVLPQAEPGEIGLDERLLTAVLVLG